jgi:hypothetical protein
MNDQHHDTNEGTRDFPEGARWTNAAHSTNSGRSPMFERSGCVHGVTNELNQFENDIDIKAGRHQPTTPPCGGKLAASNQANEAVSGHDDENVGADGQSHVAKTMPLEENSSSLKTDSHEPVRPARSMEGCVDAKVKLFCKCESDGANIQPYAHQRLCILKGESANMTLRKDCNNDDGLPPNFMLLRDLPCGGTEDETNRDLPRSIAAAARGIDQAPELCNGGCSGACFGHAREDSLAIAVAVVGDEEDDVIPSALKYDPEIKTSPRRSRRFQLYFVLATIVMTATCASVTFGILQGNSPRTTEPPTPPTAAPTTDREGNGIFYQLIEIVGETNLKKPNSSQGRAADWIIKKDPMALSTGSDTLTQRFLLTLFYISTTEDKQWLSCNPPGDQEGDECTLRESTTAGQVGLPVSTTVLGRWLSARHECEWAGIKCDEFNQIRTIDLAGQEIRGTFPSEILLLPFLQSIALPVNELYGTLPSELSSTKHLLNIELQYNYLTGQIPSEWYKIFRFQSINIAGNFITGSISTEIGGLRTLKGWFIQENALEGTIPTEFGKVPSIGRCICRLFQVMIPRSHSASISQRSLVGRGTSSPELCHLNSGTFEA